MDLEKYLAQFPNSNTNLNKFIQKDSLNLQCTYVPPIAILHKQQQKIDFSDVMNLLQNYQNYNTREFRQSHIDFDEKTFYVTIHDEKKSILKDGDDNAIIIINSQNIITVGIVDQFSKCKKQFLQTLYLFDKLKNDNYKQLF
ncbi:unnamed protein product [Paramecium primaurelia]|uniref:Uncharacterized protein n=1 Tax=Paramecium primaurelia TaxID=5886 RepID=A0A8S1MQ97_PARPR|nr:unnamed protein product [Paramecium primaurelia]